MDIAILTHVTSRWGAFLVQTSGLVNANIQNADFVSHALSSSHIFENVKHWSVSSWRKPVFFDTPGAEDVVVRQDANRWQRQTKHTKTLVESVFRERVIPLFSGKHIFLKWIESQDDQYICNCVVVVANFLIILQFLQYWASRINWSEHQWIARSLLHASYKLTQSP